MADSPKPARRGRRWSAGDDAALSAMWIDGVISAEIAHRLKRGEKSITARARHLGLPFRTGTPKRQITVGIRRSDYEALAKASAARRIRFTALVRNIIATHVAKMNPHVAGD